jgi:hypothetical protein
MIKKLLTGKEYKPSRYVAITVLVFFFCYLSFYGYVLYLRNQYVNFDQYSFTEVESLLEENFTPGVSTPQDVLNFASSLGINTCSAMVSPFFGSSELNCVVLRYGRGIGSFFEVLTYDLTFYFDENNLLIIFAVSSRELFLPFPELTPRYGYYGR